MLFPRSKIGYAIQSNCVIFLGGGKGHKWVGRKESVKFTMTLIISLSICAGFSRRCMIFTCNYTAYPYDHISNVSTCFIIIGVIWENS